MFKKPSSVAMEILDSETLKPRKPETDDGSETIHAIAQELIDCVHAKDCPGVASALRAAFEESRK